MHPSFPRDQAKATTGARPGPDGPLAEPPWPGLPRHHNSLVFQSWRNARKPPGALGAATPGLLVPVGRRRECTEPALATPCPALLPVALPNPLPALGHGALVPPHHPVPLRTPCPPSPLHNVLPTSFLNNGALWQDKGSFC